MAGNFRQSAAGKGFNLLAFAAVVFACGFVRAGITLPDENGDAATDLRSYRIAVNAGRIETAADLYWGLANNHGRDLVSNPDGSFVGVRDAIDSIPTDDLAKVTAELRRRHGTDAAAVIAAAEADPAYRPHDLYTAAMKSRHTTEADTAVIAAGARAMSQGDSVTAAFLASKPVPDLSGKPVPFAAPWFGKMSGFATEKSIPVTAGDTIFVGRSRHLVAMGPDGREKWAVALDRIESRDRFAEVEIDRGTVSVPAVLTDRAGRPQIVIGRFTGKMTGGWLEAFRGSDGRVLWSTRQTLPDTLVLSPAAVAGRFAYCIALEQGTDPSTGNLLLVAVDVTDGRAIWRSHLAEITELPRPDRGGGFPWLAFFMDQGPPAISGRSVVVAPGIGAVIAVDRIDGALRWVRPYVPGVVEENTLRMYRQQRIQGFGADVVRPPLPWPQLARWTDTPVVAAGIVVAAPEDTTEAFGIDLATGRQLWQSTGLPEGVPVAEIGGKVLWAGTSATAIDPRSGQGQTWPIRGNLLGVPVVAGDKVILRTTDGRVVVDGATGAAATDPAGIDFAAVVANESARATLEKSKLADLFSAAR